MKEPQGGAFSEMRGKYRTPLSAALVLAALGVFVVFIVLAVCQADTTLFLYLFVIGPGLALLTVVLLVYTVIGQRRVNRKTVWSSLGIVWVAVACAFFLDIRYHSAIRMRARWLVWSGSYKQAVLAEQSPANGELQHAEWDTWGWGGMDTTMYIVLDPKDALARAGSADGEGRFRGIPCKVLQVKRLERNWYGVTFYTGQDWDHCG